ncbi:outer membrane protein assembly factor BamB family protein [Saccharicrinis sp. GN24d3]|uniref:outer membrane protein assembly factor BamB family protein n=1 Tax=Saccharicrinis sp. GN24d3 TaxID=3458416 RepID=UPI0040369218
MMKVKCVLMLVVIAIIMGACSKPEAGVNDWPQFKKDNFRSGVAAIDLDLKTLDEVWSYKAPHQPEPAWYGPAKEDAYARSGPLPSMRDYDHAYYPIIVGESMYYSSSGDDAVHCIDTQTGNEKWAFTTGGPVRIAPTYFKGYLYFGSDDGFVYCINAFNAKLKWMFSPGNKEARKVLNNGRLISYWPIRTGVLIEDGIAYFGASLLPWKKSYICAVDAGNGSVSSAGCYVKEVNDMTLEGAMASTGKLLIQPQGRIAPAFISKASGEKKGQLPGTGGCFVLITPEKHVVHPKSSRAKSIQEYVDDKQPDYLTFNGGKEMVIKGDTSYIINDNGVSAFHRKTKKTLWVRRNYEAHKVLQSGNALYLGCADSVFALSLTNGLPLWKHKVNGVVQALSIANDALYVSTNEGYISCFKAGGKANVLYNLNLNKEAVVESIEKIKNIDILEKNLKLFLGPEITALSHDSVRLSFQTKNTKAFSLNWMSGSGDTLKHNFPVGKEHQIVIPVRKGHKYAYQLISKDGTTGYYEYDNFLNFKREPVVFGKSLTDNTRYIDLFKQLKDKYNLNEGLAYVLSNSNSDIPVAVANNLNMDVIVLSDDDDVVEDLRSSWQNQGIYSRKINIQHVEQMSRIPVSSDMANLVWGEDVHKSNADEIIRLIAPRGIAFIADTNKKWLKDANLSWQVDVEEFKNGLVLIKHPFEQEGTWTHQYGSSNNSAFGGESFWGSTRSEDFDIQWMGRPGPRFQTDRNGRKPSPLAVNGRMFVQGNQRIVALNVYNGSILWWKVMPGVRRMNMHRDCSNWAADDSHVYVVKDNKLLQLDGGTGQLASYFEVDEQNSDWGYVGLLDNAVIGSRIPKGTNYTVFHGGGGDGWYDAQKGEITHKVVSQELFALAKEGQADVWRYKPEGYIINSTITLEGSDVCFVETAQKKLSSDKRGGDNIFDRIYLVRLNAENGKVIWKHRVSHHPGIAMYSMASSSDKMVVVSSHNGKYMIYTYRMSDGKLLWKKEQWWFHGDHGAHFSRPAIVDNRLIVKPEQYNMETGENIAYNVPKSGHGCATYALTEQAIFYRGGSVSQFNFDTREFSRWERLRPDCWLSTIPAQGMVLSPEGGGGCSCGNWLETSMVLAPKSRAPLTIRTVGDKPDYKQETYGNYTQRYQPNEFADSLEVELLVKPGLKARMYYTLDGSQPNKSSVEYTGSFTITLTTNLRVALYTEMRGVERRYERKRLFNRLRPVPHIEPQRTIANGSMEVRFIKGGATGSVYYTTDGSEPDSNSLNGNKNLVIKGKTKVKACTIWREDGVEYKSEVVMEELEVPELKAAVEVTPQQGVAYDYYEGTWKGIPDLESIKPDKSSFVKEFGLEMRKRDENYGIRFKGYFSVPADGVYTIYTSTDDGNFLFLHDEMVIDNGGSHSERERSFNIGLKKGKHPFSLLYYQGGGGQVLKVSIEGPGMEKQAVSAQMLCH